MEDNWTFIAGYLLVDVRESYKGFNPLNAELNSICHLLALAGATILSTLAG
jgi:hypothetical protein